MIFSQSSTEPLSSSTPTAVLVHGLTCDHSDWALQLNALAPEYQVIAVDLRSHGKSSDLAAPRDIDTMATDVIEVCAQLGINAAVFAGHSMGTRVIASIAEQRPELARGLVFVDGSRQAQDNLETVIDGIKEQLTTPDDTRAFINKMFKQMFTGASDLKLRNHIVERATHTPADVFQDLMIQLLTWDSTRMETAFKSVRVPVQVLQSTTINAQRVRRCLKDNETVPYLEFIKSTIPQARSTIVSNTGHFTQLDAPDRVTTALRDMLHETR